MNHEPALPVAGELRRELARRSALDQEARAAVEGWSEDPRTELWDKAAAVDADNTTWLMTVVEQHGWPRESDVGEEAAEAAWLLAQHADDQPELQAAFLRHMASAVGVGEASPRLLAYLDDRVRLSEGELSCTGHSSSTTAAVCDPNRSKTQTIWLSAVPLSGWNPSKTTKQECSRCGVIQGRLRNRAARRRAHRIYQATE